MGLIWLVSSEHAEPGDDTQCAPPTPTGGWLTYCGGTTTLVKLKQLCVPKIKMV